MKFKWRYSDGAHPSNITTILDERSCPLSSVRDKVVTKMFR